MDGSIVKTIGGLVAGLYGGRRKVRGRERRGS